MERTPPPGTYRRPEFHVAENLSPLEPLRLCILSILWRASVASRREYAVTSIGPRHEERIRRMLLANDTKSADAYPIVGEFTVTATGDLIPAISAPIPSRLFGHWAWSFLLAGCEWTVFTTSHPVPEVAEFSFRDDGVVLLGARLLHESRTAALVRGHRLRSQSRRPRQRNTARE